MKLQKKVLCSCVFIAWSENNAEEWLRKPKQILALYYLFIVLANNGRNTIGILWIFNKFYEYSKRPLRFLFAKRRHLNAWQTWKLSWVFFIGFFSVEMENSSLVSIVTQKWKTPTTHKVHEFSTFNFHSKMPWKLLIKFHLLRLFISQKFQKKVSPEEKMSIHMKSFAIPSFIWVFIVNVISSKQKKNYIEKPTTVHTWMWQLSYNGKAIKRESKKEKKIDNNKHIYCEQQENYFHIVLKNSFYWTSETKNKNLIIHLDNARKNVTLISWCEVFE